MKRNKIFKYVLQLGIIYGSLLLWYNLFVIMLIYILKQQLDGGVLDHFIISIIVFPFFTMALFLIFNLTARVNFVKPFKNNLIFISLSCFGFILLYFILFDFHRKLIPDIYLNSIMRYVIIYGSQLVEYFIILFVLAWVFNINKE